MGLCLFCLYTDQMYFLLSAYVSDWIQVLYASAHLKAVWCSWVHKQRASGVLSPNNMPILSWQTCNQHSDVLFILYLMIAAAHSLTQILPARWQQYLHSKYIDYTVA